MFRSRKAQEPSGSAPAAGGAEAGREPKPAPAGSIPQPSPPHTDGPGATSANGASSTPGAAPSPEEAQRRAAIAIRQSLAFAQIISVLMRSPHYKHYTLADLEWLVFPPLLTGQFSIAEAGPKEGGPRVPVAVALWASVSAEVDKRLSENLTTPIRLRPDEWRSGEILWLVDAVGDGRVLPGLLRTLSENTFGGQEVKMRVPGTQQPRYLSTLQSPGRGQDR